jgi:glycogen(starch) synthase
MHVLMTADTLGGVWTYTRELATGLVRRGHRVTLISFGKCPSPGQKKWMDGLDGLRYWPTEYRVEWMQDSSEDVVKSAALLEQALRELSPDLLHLNQYAFGALQTAIPKLVVAHSDVVSWWVSVHGCEPPDDSWTCWYRELVTQGINSADLVVAPSQWMLDALKTYYTVAADSRVIYNARTASLFEPDASKENCVFTVGRLWDHAKQVSLLLERKHSVPVYVAGSQAHPEKLAVGTYDREETGAIRFLGEQSEEQLRDLYAQSAIYCATSCYEPFGLAPLEAALSGCAVIANDIPSFRELWGDAVCYFRRNHAGSLAARIEVLSRDSRLRRHYANRAMERARAIFQLDRMLDRYEAAYNRLVKQEAYA